ncbi:hypothetical protein BKA67DRAFT_137745 [Truncatella angustata]|uniref:Uncharacterized protein n=1 Tax=Truncatella angustata TaxID=152316 RepID=A0A9P8REF2_9PEZI|nr:uncharacterized protein BKA67DRAFT_137745 [Truncatella angustata]KAH6639948.1 hypothetical protein BKA67DRAFT_137745 [Truncatella angustata]
MRCDALLGAAQCCARACAFACALCCALCAACCALAASYFSRACLKPNLNLSAGTPNPTFFPRISSPVQVFFGALCPVALSPNPTTTPSLNPQDRTHVRIPSIFTCMCACS